MGLIGALGRCDEGYFTRLKPGRPSRATENIAAEAGPGMHNQVPAMTIDVGWPNPVTSNAFAVAPGRPRTTAKLRHVARRSHRS